MQGYIVNLQHDCFVVCLNFRQFVDNKVFSVGKFFQKSNESDKVIVGRITGYITPLLKSILVTVVD